MKKRSQIADEYKWNLDSYIKDNDEIEKIFKIIDDLIKIAPKYKDKLQNSDILYEAIAGHKQEEMAISRLAHYISHKLNVDSSDIEMIKLEQRFSTAYSRLLEAESFILPQIYKLPTKFLQSLLSDPRFKDYDNFINDIIREKPHRLDEKSSELLAKMSSFLGGSEQIHSILVDSEMKYKEAVDSKGKKMPLNNETYPKYLRSNDPSLRKTAFEHFMDGYSQLNKTFSELYINDIEYDKFYTKLTKYDNLLESVLFSEKLPRAVFDNIIKYTEKYIPLLQKYIKTRAKIADNKKFAYYDLFEDRNSSKKISISDAQNLILSALSPLGTDYSSNLKRKMSDHSIDYLPNENKNSGAYCSHCYGAKTMVLTNFINDYNSVSTLAHELGHCINAEYFNSAQPYEKADISTFAAEIASTVNELLLFQYMMKISKPKDRKYYLKKFLDDVRSTIFRQIIFTEFEHEIHQKMEQDIPVTYNDLNECYMNINKKFYGRSCILPSCLKYEWMRVPHFYSPYYVFTYATGMVTAITIVNRILNEKDFYTKYIDFLKNGVNKPAVEVLKEIGIDLASAEPYDEAFAFAEKQLKIYISLYK